jgi:phenylpyruvate tautomerase PptA (4-oxalocrotonate tautomerase family)
MPFVSIKVLKGALSKKIIFHTLFLIEEADFEGWGDGGNPVTPDMLKALLTGKP